MSRFKFKQIKALRISPRERSILSRIVAEDDPIQAPRALAIIRFAQNDNRTEIARQAKVTREAMYSWIAQFESRRALGVSVRKSVAAQEARVMSGHRLPLRRLLEATQVSKDWSIEDIKAFFAKQGLAISTGTAWNYKHQYGKVRLTKSFNISEKARANGIPPAVAYARLYAGWNVTEATSRPVKKYRLKKSA